MPASPFESVFILIIKCIARYSRSGRLLDTLVPNSGKPAAATSWAFDAWDSRTTDTTIVHSARVLSAELVLRDVVSPNFTDPTTQ